MALARKIGIDANLFIYVLEGHPVFSRRSLALFTAVESGVVSGQASELVYLEVISRASMTTQDITAATSFLTNTGTNFTAISKEVLMKAAGLRRSMGLKTPDAIHAASASVSNCDYFVTNDVGLIKKGVIDGVKIISLEDFQL